MEQSGNKIQILYSVQKEIDFPNTPSWVKKEAMSSVFTKETLLEAEELKRLKEVERIIVGKGDLEKRRPDCRHVFEVIQYGEYFITTDNDILKHSDIIFKEYHTYIMKPSELLEIFREYNNHT